MYAVIQTGGKQYRVELGSEIEVDRLDAEPGQSIDIAHVLLVADGDTAAIGRPVVEGATVSASVVRQTRGDKVVVFKYKPKARTRVKNGHRAELTVLRISDIAWDGRSAAQRAAAERARVELEAQQAAKAAQEAAARQAAADQALAAQLATAKAAAVEPATEGSKPVRRARTEATATTATEAAATEAAAEPVTAAADEPADETGKDA